MEKRKRVFIIDDEVDLCLLMKAYFLRKNCEVYIAHSFDGALARVKEYEPDLIFLSTEVCPNQEENIKQLKNAVPGVEIRINNGKNW